MFDVCFTDIVCIFMDDSYGRTFDCQVKYSKTDGGLLVDYQRVAP